MAAREEYSKNKTKASFKCNVFGLIHNMGILTFELFEGGFIVISFIYKYIEKEKLEIYQTYI